MGVTLTSTENQSLVSVSSIIFIFLQVLLFFYAFSASLSGLLLSSLLGYLTSLSFLRLCCPFSSLLPSLPYLPSLPSLPYLLGYLSVSLSGLLSLASSSLFLGSLLGSLSSYFLLQVFSSLLTFFSSRTPLPLYGCGSLSRLLQSLSLSLLSLLSLRFSALLYGCGSLGVFFCFQTYLTLLLASTRFLPMPQTALLMSSRISYAKSSSLFQSLRKLRLFACLSFISKNQSTSLQVTLSNFQLKMFLDNSIHFLSSELMAVFNSSSSNLSLASFSIQSISFLILIKNFSSSLSKGCHALCIRRIQSLFQSLNDLISIIQCFCLRWSVQYRALVAYLQYYLQSLLAPIYITINTIYINIGMSNNLTSNIYQSESVLLRQLTWNLLGYLQRMSWGIFERMIRWQDQMLLILFINCNIISQSNNHQSCPCPPSLSLPLLSFLPIIPTNPLPSMPPMSTHLSYG